MRSKAPLLGRRLRPHENWMWHGAAKTCAGPVEAKQFERRVSDLKRPADDPYPDPEGEAKQDAHDHWEQRRTGKDGQAARLARRGAARD